MHFGEKCKCKYKNIFEKLVSLFLSVKYFLFSLICSFRSSNSIKHIMQYKLSSICFLNLFIKVFGRVHLYNFLFYCTHKTWVILFFLPINLQTFLKVHKYKFINSTRIQRMSKNYSFQLQY